LDHRIVSLCLFLELLASAIGPHTEKPLVIDRVFEHLGRDALFAQPRLEIFDVPLEGGGFQPTFEELHERLLLIHGHRHCRTQVAGDDQS
jgi:hypothetical protein